MSERQKESQFLKSLILCDDSAQCHHLQERMKKAEKDERCIRCAFFLVSVFGLLSLAGIGYSAVFVPEFARFSSHIATRIFCALGLGSLICMGVFLGLWLWYRAVSNRVYAECRRFARSLVEARLPHVSHPSPAIATQSGTCLMYQIETPKPQDEAELLQKAS